MAQTPVSHNPSENPDAQPNSPLGDDITHFQEQSARPAALPKNLVDWLARINRRSQALNQEKLNDTH